MSSNNFESECECDVADIRLESSGASLSAGSCGNSDFTFITSQNTRMRRICDRARDWSYELSPIVIRGERGSGKSLLARMVHHWGSQHSEPPFISLISQELTLENFSRAVRHAISRSGHGTVVLDSFEKLPTPLLAGLSDLILGRSQTFMGVPLKIDESAVRLIAITREPPEKALRVEGDNCKTHFKGMINLLMIPPLRERREDIILMAQRFLSHFAREDHRRALTFTPQARLALTSYDWPGNVRELRSIIKRSAVVVQRAEVDVSDLALPSTGNSHPLWPDGYLSLDALERMYILRVIRESSTLEQAARILKVDITTLWRKRRRYGI